jgi:hypothetical protein
MAKKKTPSKRTKKMESGDMNPRVRSSKNDELANVEGDFLLGSHTCGGKQRAFLRRRRADVCRMRRAQQTKTLCWQRRRSIGCARCH